MRLTSDVVLLLQILKRNTTIHQIIFGNNHNQNLFKKQEKQPNHGKVEVDKVAFL